MRNTITIRRWRIDLYENAIYVQKQPDPKCRECRGAGSIETSLTEHDQLVEPCGCWDPYHYVRIPVRLRAPITERYPF